MQITIQVSDGYIPPEGPLAPEQYVEFVMNRACESYRNQYGAADVAAGLAAACAAYNASLPVPADPPQE